MKKIDILKTKKNSDIHVNFQKNSQNKKDSSTFFASDITRPEDESRFLSRKKVFRIKKVYKVREDEEPSVIDNDDVINECRNKRISAFSKVNFSKLTEQEKDERLKNLLSLSQKLKSKVRKLELKLKSGSSKIFSIFFNHSLKKKKEALNVNFDIEKLCTALKKLKTHQGFEYKDQQLVIETLINLIAEDPEILNTINFKKICCQIRMFLPSNKVQFVGKRGNRISYSFPNQDVFITSKEFDYYSKYNTDSQIIQKILGVKIQEEKIPTDKKIYFDQKLVLDSLPIQSCLLNNKSLSPFDELLQLKNILYSSPTPNNANLYNNPFNNLREYLSLFINNQEVSRNFFPIGLFDSNFNLEQKLFNNFLNYNNNHM
jgi:hypothetical protein